MKNKLHLWGLFAVALVAMASCTKDDSGFVGNGNTYILNYGSYSGSKSTITLFDDAELTTSTDYYESVNGVSMTSNVQNICYADGNIYMTGNNTDAIFYVDANSMEQTVNALADDAIVKPRDAVSYNNTLYVSCWEGDVWSDLSLGSIVKIDLSSFEVTGSIDMPGGPEGLEIVDGKLYVALNYDDSIAVVDLATEAISYIATPTSASYFLKDNDDNLYVSLAYSYYTTVTDEGLGYINTDTDELTVYSLSGVSTSYADIMAANADFSKIYLVASAYVEQEDGTWVSQGSLQVFDVASSTFESTPFVSGATGIQAVATNAETDEVYVLYTNGTTSNGALEVYQADGTLETTLETGISPAHLITID